MLTITMSPGYKGSPRQWEEQVVSRLRKNGTVGRVNVAHRGTPRVTVVAALDFSGFPVLESECSKVFATSSVDGNAQEGVVTVYQNTDFEGSDEKWFNSVAKEMSKICLKLGLKLDAPQKEKSEKPISISFEYRVRITSLDRNK